MRFFNTAGPVNCVKHYCLDPLSRFDLEEILSLIRQEKYFVLHAPLQTGKTSSLLALQEYLNAGSEYKALYMNVERAQPARENIAQGIHAIIDEIFDRCASNHIIPDPRVLIDGLWDQYNELSALSTVFSRLSIASTLPVVILLDEIDSLVGDTLISVLRQIRGS